MSERDVENGPKMSAQSTDVVCPFCSEGDFDLPGLKAHFDRGWCDAFEATERLNPRGRAAITPSQDTPDEA